MKILLDTCAFLWLSQQPAQLSPAAVDIINDPGNALTCSDVSIWEITLKNSAGKLPLPQAPRTWIPSKLLYHQLQRLSTDLDSIIRSGELPPMHRDPFDRLLAAQAITHGMTILSPDLPLSTLGAARIW